MAEYAYPKALTGMQDTQWSTFIHYMAEDGATSDAAFTPTANGSGMTVTLAPGDGIVQGILTGNSAAAPVTIAGAPASGSGLSRIDTIVKRLDRTKTPVVQTAVLTGTPSATPAPKALTQDPAGVFEWPVADVRLNAGDVAVTQAAITDRRSFTGVNVAKWSTALRPVSPRQGTLGLNTTLGLWEWWDGGAWKPLNDSGTVPISKGGTGATTAIEALNALGIFVQATAPAHAAGRVWIKRAA